MTDAAARMQVRGPSLGQSGVCETILRALPQWFGIEEAIVQYVRDVAQLPTFTATMDGQTVGFVTIRKHFDSAAEVYVMGVVPQAHRQGVGAALLRRAEDWLKGEGVKYLQVKTLSESRPNAEYARTRAFYRAMGFEPLEEFKTLWSERNPCLLLVKRL